MPSHPTTPSHPSNPGGHTGPVRPSNPGRPAPVNNHGNWSTPAHNTHMQQTNARVNTVMRSNTRVNILVTGHSNIYVNSYRPVFVTRYSVYNNYYPRWGGYYRPWYRHGFYGGFYYPLYPVYDIHTHFYCPLVFWLYADSWDDNYYRTWYGSDWGSYPVLQTRFSRPGVYYPTVAIRDLALGVASMPMIEQGNFRLGMINLMNQLEQKIAQGLSQPISFGRNDIAITHYQMLEEAITIEGFATTAGRQFSFKALLDLREPSTNLVFVPTSDQQSDAALLELRLLNERIEQLGGTVSYVDAPAPVARRGD
ncbi:MAG: hypothetical protein HY074_17210 [Deltaproteobacteria bacterium]|nr:hypothetical protein [Deltaproteobacteria bacterium]